MKAKVTYLCGCETTSELRNIMPSCSLHGRPILKCVLNGRHISLQEASEIALKNLEKPEEVKIAHTETEVLANYDAKIKIVKVIRELESLLKDLEERISNLEDKENANS